MRAVIRKYEMENDYVLQFLEEKCVRVKDDGIKAKDLFTHFKIWCKSNGYFAMSVKKFNAGINLHPEWHDGIIKEDGCQYYKGIGLRGR